MKESTVKLFYTVYLFEMFVALWMNLPGMLFKMRKSFFLINNTQFSHYTLYVVIYCMYNEITRLKYYTFNIQYMGLFLIFQWLCDDWII